MSDSIKQRLRIINGAGTAIVLTLLAGTVAFGIVPLYREGMYNDRESAKLTKQLHELDALNLKLALAEREKSARELRLSDVETRLPSSNGMNQFVQELARAAEEAGLQVDKVMPLKEIKDAGAYKSMSVQLTGTGDWDTCYRFLTSLRGNNRKLTRLDDLSLQLVPDKSAEKPICQMFVEVTTYIAR